MEIVKNHQHTKPHPNAKDITRTFLGETDLPVLQIVRETLERKHENPTKMRCFIILWFIVLIVCFLMCIINIS
jgi:hypothetical protein